MKVILKECARYILFKLKQKPYRIKTQCGIEIRTTRELCDKESFYGYYDHSPERNGKVIFHEMNYDFVNIIIKDLHSNNEKVIGKSKAFNWQLGTRAMWLDDDRIVYNDFDGVKYIGCVYSLANERIVQTLGFPIQDYCSKGFFLGVNYQRLRSFAKEYGYYCINEMIDADYDDYDNDGIWYIDAETGKTELLLSIRRIINYKTEERFLKGKHFVNHIMINPNGESFIFIHRYYVGKERYDRLMYYDFKELKCLLPEKHQSHYCWLNNYMVFGYGEYNGHWGFHIVKVDDGKVEKCAELTRVHPKDGHPTICDDWVVVDSYPYLSRMQILSAYNFKTHKYIDLLEVFHDLKHKGYNRCDLHPRFSNDGKRVYFDTIYTGKRMLCYVDISKIIK